MKLELNFDLTYLRFLFRNSAIAVAVSEPDVTAVAIMVIETGDVRFCGSSLLVESGCGVGSFGEEGEVDGDASWGVSELWRGLDVSVEVPEEAEFCEG